MDGADAGCRGRHHRAEARRPGTQLRNDVGADRCPMGRALDGAPKGDEVYRIADGLPRRSLWLPSRGGAEASHPRSHSHVSRRGPAPFSIVLNELQVTRSTRWSQLDFSGMFRRRHICRLGPPHLSGWGTQYWTYALADGDSRPSNSRGNRVRRDASPSGPSRQPSPRSLNYRTSTIRRRPRTVTFVTDQNGMIVERDEADNLSGGDPRNLRYFFSGLQLGQAGNNGTANMSYVASISNRLAPSSTWALTMPR